jgi:hypothetical protein
MSTTRRNLITRARAATLVGCAALALVAGCRRLEMDVHVSRDGGGERRLTMTVEPDDQSAGKPTEAQARELLGVTAARGWREGVTQEADENGRPRQLTTYTRESRVASLGDWSATGGDIRLRVAPPGAPHAEAQLTNRVEVEMGRSSGGATWSYRETFTWTGLLEALADAAADHYRDKVAAAFPVLGAVDLAELHGLARGAFTVGIRAGGAGKDGSEMDEDMVAATLAGGSVPVVARACPGAATDRLQEIATAVVKDEDRFLSDLLDREFPGFGLAGQTNFVLTLRLPGRVVETNGKLADDGSVTWDFGGGDLLGKPRVCWAKSEG